MVEQLDKKIEQLDVILVQMFDAHDQLHKLLLQKREALSRADHAQVVACSAQENQRVQLIAELEKQRALLVGELTVVLTPDATELMTLRDVAARLSEPARGRLLMRREALRSKVAAVQQDAGVIHRTTEALAQHMHGLMQTISGAVSGIGSYANRGARPQSAMAISTFSLTA